MSVKALHNRINRLSDRLKSDRGEVISIMLIDSYTTGDKPDKVIELKVFSKSHELYVKPENLIDQSELPDPPSSIDHGETEWETRVIRS